MKTQQGQNKGQKLLKGISSYLFKEQKRAIIPQQAGTRIVPISNSNFASLSLEPNFTSMVYIYPTTLIDKSGGQMGGSFLV